MADRTYLYTHLVVPTMAASPWLDIIVKPYFNFRRRKFSARRHFFLDRTIYRLRDEIFTHCRGVGLAIVLLIGISRISQNTSKSPDGADIAGVADDIEGEIIADPIQTYTAGNFSKFMPVARARVNQLETYYDTLEDAESGCRGHKSCTGIVYNHRGKFGPGLKCGSSAFHPSFEKWVGIS